jgi:hypothetical protein
MCLKPNIFYSFFKGIKIEKLPHGIAIGCFVFCWILFAFVIISGKEFCIWKQKLT